MEKELACPRCGAPVVVYDNPAPTVDVVIYAPERGVVLIERRNPPYGHALPGGFIDRGECAEQAARREVREECRLEVALQGVLGVYSDPKRDPRGHTLSIVFVARPLQPASLCAGDDARRAFFVPLAALPADLAFDHRHILDDFLSWQRGERPLAPVQPDPAEEGSANAAPAEAR